MLIPSALVLCLSILTNVIGQECGTVISEEDDLEMKTRVAAVNTKRQTGNSSYDFGIYFNVVASNRTEEGGWVPQKQIDDQITLLNSRFLATGTGIRFHLLNVTRILNQNWHENVDSINGTLTTQALAMKSYLHRGRSIHLNVYTVALTPTHFGFSSFPVRYARSPAQDGIVLGFTTLPGGSSLIRQGGSLIHECGHWLGLRHTFQGGCTEEGDGVADTAPEAKAASGCPIGQRSSCNSDLLDPIFNYMDYTNETCRRDFTPGQIRLMHSSILAYRT